MAPTPHSHRWGARDVIDSLQEALRTATDRHTGGVPSATAELTRNASFNTQIRIQVTANMDADPRKVERHARAVLKAAVATYREAARLYPEPKPAPVKPAKPVGKMTTRQAAGIAVARRKTAAKRA